MKNPGFKLWLALATFAVVTSAQAHPGHEPGAHGLGHVIGSAYHIAMFLGMAVGFFLAAELIRKTWAHRLQVVGVAWLAAGVMFWVALH